MGLSLIFDFYKIKSKKHVKNSLDRKIFSGYNIIRERKRASVGAKALKNL